MRIGNIWIFVAVCFGISSCSDAVQQTAGYTETINPVFRVSPENGSTNIDVLTNIVATFNEPVYGIDDTTFIVQGIEGQIEYNELEKKAIFTPLHPLSPFTTYSVKLTGSIVDKAGNNLKEFTSYFTTEAGFVTAVAPGVGDASLIDTGVDGNGNIFTVWKKLNGNNYRYFASIRQNNVWIETHEFAEIGNIQPSISASDLSFATLYVSSTGDLVSSVYDEDAWISTTLDTSITKSVLIASNGSGYVAVWTNGGETRASIYSQGQWKTPDVIGIGISGLSRISANNNGYAVTWVERDPICSFDQVHANVYSNNSWHSDDSSLSSTTLISDEVDPECLSGPSYAYDPFVLGSNGSGYLAAWYQTYEEGGSGLFTSMFTNSSDKWSSPEAINTILSNANVPSVASDGTGYAVVWSNYDDLFEKDLVFANFFKYASTDPSSGFWEGEKIINDPVDGFVSNSQIVSNGESYLLVWEQDELGVKTISARYFDQFGWKNIKSINDNDIGPLINGPIVVSAGSTYSLSWVQQNGLFDDLMFTRYDGLNWSETKIIDDPDIKGNVKSTDYKLFSVKNGSGVLWTQLNPAVDLTEFQLYGKVGF